MITEHPIFRIVAPTSQDVEQFHRDGYIAYPDIFTDEALAGVTDEILNDTSVREFLDQSDEDRLASNQLNYFVRPWNDRGYWADRLIDAPLVTALLKATIGPDYHFCHSAMNVSTRGSQSIGFHQDHHHWFHENPVNIAERDHWYIQILYYPNGFTRGDKNLSVIPGSHRVSPTSEATPERLLAGDFDEEAGQALKQVDLEMPPGSMVYINARMFHAVAPKPLDSPQAYRLFTIDIYKQAGPPHRYTQEIPPEWIASASPGRKKMFDREAYTPECWTG